MKTTKILLTIPSNIEAEILIPHLSSIPLFEFLIAGVGIHNTLVNTTTSLLKNHYAMAIQLGIAGSFRPQIEKKSMVIVEHDCFADIGFQEKGQFIPLEKRGLDTHFTQSRSYQGLLPHALPMVKGITVNTINRCPDHLQKIRKTFNPDIETMEGAAFYMACQHARVPALQIRAISNMVEEGNLEHWDIQTSLQLIIQYMKAFYEQWK